MSGIDLYDAIAAVGFAAPDAIIWDGKLHRFASDADRRHSKDAWYVAFDDGRGKAASFGSWRDGSKHVWSNGTGRQLTAAEHADIERQKAASQKAAQAEMAQAALRAQRLYEQAEATIAHGGYLERKGIACPEGVRAVNGLSSRAFGFEGEEWKVSGLIVPMRDRNGDIRSLQIIPEDKKRIKLFMPRGQTSKVFHVLGTLDGASKILIAEGLATAQSLRQATGLPCVVAFSAGNLEATAAVVRSSNATASVVLCADDDEAGRRFAEKAAKVCNGSIVYPGGGFNDFNDLHQAKGLTAVKVAVLGEEEPENEDWRADLIVKHKDDGSQTIPCRVHNLILILGHAEQFAGRLRFNELSAQVSVDGVDIDDVGPVVIKASLEKEWINERVPTGDVMDALGVVARRNTYHPVRSYLRGLVWDGTERIPHFFEDFCGAPRDDYHMAVARSLFVSAVARVFKPGCKVDTMVILQSLQGLGKSRLWLTLFGEWCAEITASLADKDFYSNLRGLWVADFSELDAFSKAETTQIKRILTSQSDSYRPHYGRAAVTFPRQCIFVGGTNRDDWNNDSTGARRFLPVTVTDKIEIDGVAACRDQLWAEAVVRFERGEIWWDIPNALDHQDATYAEDSWEDKIALWTSGLESHRSKSKDETTVLEVLSDCLGIDIGKQTRSDQTRAGNALRHLGWKAKQEFVASIGKRVRVYRRKGSAQHHG